MQTRGAAAGVSGLMLVVVVGLRNRVLQFIVIQSVHLSNGEYKDSIQVATNCETDTENKYVYSSSDLLVIISLVNTDYQVTKNKYNYLTASFPVIMLSRVIMFTKKCYIIQLFVQVPGIMYLM